MIIGMRMIVVLKYNNADNDNSAIDTSWYDYKNDQRDCIITVKMIMITVL